MNKENVAFIHNGVSAMKKNENLSLVGKWVELEFMLSKTSLTLKDMSSVICGFREKKDTKVKVVLLGIVPQKMTKKEHNGSCHHRKLIIM
jgi:hypothetical protein